MNDDEIDNAVADARDAANARPSGLSNFLGQLGLLTQGVGSIIGATNANKTNTTKPAASATPTWLMPVVIVAGLVVLVLVVVGISRR